ncbi:tRNA wybutosine-synthesizing protein 2 homolog [Esox lucius]|uniref:tRNA wybutosine-synthesizing protein 2 homolog n=1 Tax=Esox lucius TaxID=8010 RepID=A0A6Q2YB02_ESOLU|nr:tRNA wybutosine-synthesizing protein 2 homolog [Esox lucius]
MDGTPCVRVLQRHAQQCRKYLQAQGFLDLRFCMQKHSNGTVSLPIIPSCLPRLDLESLQNKVACGGRCEVVRIKAPQLSKRERRISSSDKLVIVLQDLLESHGERWTEDLREDIHHSYQRHGDLVLLGENMFSLPVWIKIGPDLWPTVAQALGAERLAKIGRIYKDGFRTPVVTMLVGNDSWVSHVDNKIRYEFDVIRCMFSAGNITEKLRVASFNCATETVVDLYAGIGYFTLPYLVHARASHVHACEWNPDAVKALQRNLDINGVSHRCTVHYGDNRQLPLCDLADRVNLGLIPSSEDGWPVACRLLRKTTGGVLHVHQNVTLPPLHPVGEKVEVNGGGPDQVSPKRSDREAWSVWAQGTAVRIASLLQDINGGPWTTDIKHIEHVKSYAPHIHHVVLDLECRPL